MAVRPNTPPVPGRTPAPGRPPGAGGNLRRNPSPGPGAIRPVQPGSVRPSNPRVPPGTPFQPGAPPSPPLNPIGAGLGGLLLLGQALWGLLNQRPPAEEGEPDWAASDGVAVTYPEDSWFWLRWSTAITSSTTDCSTGDPGGGTTIGGGGVWGFGRGFRVVGPMTKAITKGCDGVAGVNGPLARYEVLNGSGAVIQSTEMFAGGASIGAGTSGSVAISVSPAPQFWPGYTDIPAPVGGDTPGQFAPGMFPELEPLPEVAPMPLPAPAPVTPPDVAPPVPAVAPAFPRPAPAPGGAPRPGPGRLPGGAPAPAPLPGPSAPPALPQAVPITAGGVQPQLPPAPGTTATGTTVLPGGQQLAPNGPRPTPQAMATELGKLEQKLELALAPDGPLSLLELLNKVIDQVENIEFLIERLFPQGPYEFPAGAYQLAPICDRDSEGELVPPLQAPWTGGEGELTELRQKLDALALLIQHHKTLKQPTCGGQGSGPASNVTVHFESD